LPGSAEDELDEVSGLGKKSDAGFFTARDRQLMVSHLSIANTGTTLFFSRNVFVEIQKLE